MKGDLPVRGFVIALALALAIGIFAVPVKAQVGEGLDLLPFPRQSATITMNDTGLNISPSQLNPGPVTFTVVNNSSAARGVYVTGEDRVGTPLLRHSMRIMPGASTTMGFWLYQGNNYTFRDFTARSIVDGESVFTSRFSTQMSIGNPLSIGRGPQYQRQTGTITITSAGIEVNPQTTMLGPITFNVVNKTNQARGVVITGEDRTGSPIIRYTRMISPGSSTSMSFWLYEGKNYTIRDFTRRYAVGNQMRFNSSFRAMLAVHAGLGAGPDAPDN